MAVATSAVAENTNWLNYRKGEFVIKDYKFASGETLPELKPHYRTLGTAQRKPAGEIVNGLLLLQGGIGTGANWLRSTLANELFEAGQPLDPSKYFIIMTMS
jgi:homoserine O-acetyltransferase/O-succinyltransferase